MSSNINPNNINTHYPIAGQDNDSQGFRDNFTNTKTNFEFTKDEINDLQNSVLLKNTLQGSDESVNDHNDLNGNMITSALMKNMRQVAITGGTGEIDVSEGSYHQLNLDDNTNSEITLTFINIPNTTTPVSVSKFTVDLIVTNDTNPSYQVYLPVDTIGYKELEYYRSDANGAYYLDLPTGRFVYEFFTIKGDVELMVTPLIQSTY